MARKITSPHHFTALDVLIPALLLLLASFSFGSAQRWYEQLQTTQPTSINNEIK